MIRVSTFNGKRVAVFGLGGSGLATALALQAGGADVAAWDDAEAARERARAAGVPVVDLRAAGWAGLEALVLAPGVPLTHPEPHWTVKLAERTWGAGFRDKVIGDIELFFRERRALAPDCQVIAITGTNGKSTTTALIAHILRSAGRDVQMGGNIGKPVLELEPFATGRIYVLELSSFQIDLTPSLNPTVGVLLNITPDHLDRHGSMEIYAAVKRRLIERSAHAIVGAQAISVLGRIASADIISGGREGDVHVVDGWLCQGQKRIVELSRLPKLRGAHNAENAAAACAATTLFNVPDEAIVRGLMTYPGLPHRMEQVGRIGRVVFINDSKATNADSTEKALASWERDLYVILGGKPKEGGIVPLAPYFPRIAKAYLIGQAAEDFAATLDAHKVPFERAGTLDVATRNAAADAAKSQGAEPVVLLSPACASYDQFKNFEVRGDTFRALVRTLIDASPPGGAP